MKNWKQTIVILAAVLALTLMVNGAAVAQYITKVYLGDQGDTLVLQSGGKIAGTPGATVVVPGLNVNIPTTVATATPNVSIRNYGLGESLEIQNAAGTPVYAVHKDGSATYTGFSSGGGAVGGAVFVTAPTAVASATPAFGLNNLGADNDTVSIQRRGSVLFTMYNDGSWADVGTATHTGKHTFNGAIAVVGPTAAATTLPAIGADNLGATNDILALSDSGTPVLMVDNGGHVNGGAKGVIVVGPTALATAVPAMIVDNNGAGNVNFEIRKEATPQFAVLNDGSVVGQVLQYGTSGKKIICGTDTITGTGVLAHGLTTPSVVLVSLGQDPDGDADMVTFSNAAATVTAKVWNVEATPNATGAAVDWCVIGTP
jgi:hypothetical protein